MRASRRPATWAFLVVVQGMEVSMAWVVQGRRGSEGPEQMQIYGKGRRWSDHAACSFHYYFPCTAIWATSGCRHGEVNHLSPAARAFGNAAVPNVESCWDCRAPKKAAARPSPKGMSISMAVPGATARSRGPDAVELREARQKGRARLSGGCQRVRAASAASRALSQSTRCRSKLLSSCPSVDQTRSSRIHRGG